MQFAVFVWRSCAPASLLTLGLLSAPAWAAGEAPRAPDTPASASTAPGERPPAGLAVNHKHRPPTLGTVAPAVGSTQPLPLITSAPAEAEKARRLAR